MKLLTTLAFAISICAAPQLIAAEGTEPIDERHEKVVSLVQQFCIDCHNSADTIGGLDLESLDEAELAKQIGAGSGGLEKIAKRLMARQMPPPVNAEDESTVDRPDEQEYVAAQAALESLLDKQAAQNPWPGTTDSLRHLNRTEYRNSIRDLLAVDVEVDEMLPADQLAHGFDNVTVGELSPVLLSRYINAAQQISRLAVGGPQPNPGGRIVRLPPDLTQDTHIAGLPLGTRGGVLLKHLFPSDGEYEIQLRLMRDRDENIEGLKGEAEIDVLLDKTRLHRFVVAPPKTKEGWSKDDTLVDANLNKRFRVTAGPHDIGVTFPQKSSSLLEIRRQPFDASFNRHRHPRREPAIYEVSIVGPFALGGPGDTPSRRRIFKSCNTKPETIDEAQTTAKEILQRLMRIAFRRPPTEEDFKVPMRFFETRYKADGFEAGIEAALTTILVNPHFLFRAESVPENVAIGDAYHVDDFELASRLSFFLWSSLPDDRLLTLAKQGELSDVQTLRQEAQRMLADERSEALVDSFASQWLYLRNLESFRPDMRLFPDFDENLRRALRGETEHLFRNMLQNDLSVLKLIDSDVSFLNERLAKHYGIPGVLGSHFRPVKFDDNRHHRGGLLRHGSILAVTSYATRTSPTIRGNWILENILGTPPPPQPPNVPALKEKTVNNNPTVRERLAEHRKNPACASCHNLMDPVGFALENFDAVGRWRVFDAGLPIDSSGALPDGQQIDSVDALEAGIIERPEIFVGAMTEKLLTFALGRGSDAHDGPAIRQVIREATEKDYRFSSLIEGIVTSTPFRMRVAK